MTADQGGLSLHLQRVLPAPRPLVFRAAVDPVELVLWWGPRGFTTPSVDFDPRVGAPYRMRMQPPEGEAFHLAGEFVEVEPPARLVYTFRWEEPAPDDRETVVTMEFGDRFGSTLLAVDQGVFTTEERLRLHEQGWSESLDRLEALFLGEGSIRSP
jgi:uncharacterized protein YndB with AHSA1/START domain